MNASRGLAGDVVRRVRLTEHPARAAGCRPGEILAFEHICLGRVKGHGRKTLDALAAKGLIDFSERRMRDRLGVYVVREPYAPVEVHRQWAEWCAEHV